MLQIGHLALAAGKAEDGTDHDARDQITQHRSQPQPGRQALRMRLNGEGFFGAGQPRQIKQRRAGAAA